MIFRERVLLCILQLFMLVVLSLTGVAKEVKLSSSADIYIWTCSPGSDLYAAFGHSAIRVVDSERNIDYMFNYGMFDFNTDNFYWKFLRGETDYLLGATRGSDSFVDSYKRSGRGIISNRLSLTSDEKQELFNSLMVNAKPENRAYRYNFLFDNCATRVGRVVERSVSNRTISWRDDAEVSPTFRDVLHNYVKPDGWAGFGIYIALGSGADNRMSSMDNMFIPDSLQQMFVEATVTGSVGPPIPLVDRSEVVIRAKEISELPIYLKPLFILVVIAMCYVKVMQREITKRRFNRGLTTALYLVLGVGGLLIFFLNFFSELAVVNSNFNLLWINPLYLIFPFIRRKRALMIFNSIILFNTLLLVVIYLTSISGQTFHPYIWIAVLLIVSRSVMAILYRDSNSIDKC